jgi:uncharacterized membrane protein
MRHFIVPGLLILIGVISLGSLFIFTVPAVVLTTYMTPSTLTAIAREILLDYTTTTISCTGATPVCFVEVSPYTYTATWSGQTTPMIPVSATTTTQVSFASTGLQGDLAVLVALVLIIGGIVLFTLSHRRRNSATRKGG